MALGGALDYSFVENDDNSILSVTCRRSDNDAIIDLTGATITLKWKIEGGALVTKSMTSASPATGVATYTFAAGELLPGIMVAEVEVVIAGKKVSSIEAMRFTVRKKV